MNSKPPSAVARQWQATSTILDMIINRAGQWAMLTLGDGSVATITAADTGLGPQPMPAHNGVSLACCADAEEDSFLSAGDDGKLLLIDPEGDIPTQLVEQPMKWLDHVAAEQGGHRAYAVGKTLHRLDEMGQPLAQPYDLPSSIGGLCFSPDGKRLAASYYGGIQVFWTNAPQTEPLELKWKGSHQNLIWSPDNQVLLSSMQGGGVHGWKLGKGLDQPGEGDEMHMQGYEANVGDFAFSAGGKFLVTSGGQQGICWPFTDGGPWNKPPLMLGGTDARLVARVAPHPNDDMIALGYDDGMIVLAPLDGRMEIMISPPVAEKGAAVKGMLWNGEADTLLVTLETGAILLFTMASVSRYVRGQNSF